MFFAAKNLTEQSVEPVKPWEFKPEKPVPMQVRKDKQDRQDWYQNTATVHQFYTGIEGINPNMRVSRDNPPHKINAIAADFDVPIPDERVKEAVEAMKQKPTRIERSLGGNVRLVWELSSPLMVDNMEFATAILQGLVEHLNLNLLPGLDENAFTSPSRLLANGCEWTETGNKPIDLQAHFVKIGKEYRFKGEGLATIPLDVVETGIRAKYANFTWPSDFTLGSQGPSFWVAGSESPMSAIVKPEGMFTWSAHADHPFCPWSEILGAEFVKDFQENSIARATRDIYYDGKKYWRQINGIFASMEKDELLTFFRVECRLQSKPDKTGISQTDTALHHIQVNNRIECAAPFVFRPPGIIVFLGDRKLNTYTGKALTPSEGRQEWGPHGNFPFYSAWLSTLFAIGQNYEQEQLAWFMAWLKHYYTAAFEQCPMPGQNIFLMGGPGKGKTLLNREGIGVLVGGYIDASDYLVDGGTFNSHLVRIPHWCLDDDSPSADPRAQNRFQALFKKLASNQQMIHHKKFDIPGMTEWMGRCGATTNLDWTSSRIVGPMENGIREKVSLFRCAVDSDFVFPGRKETIGYIQKELPYFARYLLDWEPPEFVTTHPRYGYDAFHDPRLLDQAHQSSHGAPFKEILIEFLSNWFTQNPETKCWAGTVTRLLTQIEQSTAGANDWVSRSVSLSAVNRGLEQIQKEGIIKCEVETGNLKTRVWKFFRESFGK